MKVNKVQIITEILEEIPDTRNNNNELIYQYLKRMGMPTDYEYLRFYNFNISESIRRTRQKIQQRNPLLRPVESVQLNRMNIERTIKQTMRGI